MGRRNEHGLPEHLRQRPDGSYFLDFRLTLEDGTKKRVREDIGLVSKTLARSILARRLAELAGQSFRLQAPKITFRQAAEAFLVYSRGRKKSYQEDVELAARLMSFFGDRPLETLTPEAMESFLNVLKDKGKRVSHRAGVKPQWKPYKPATLNRHIACAKTIVRRASANGQIDRNTLAGMKLFKENNARDRVLTQEEYHRLLAECADHLKLIVKLAYTTAMRQGEILKLRWDQLNLREGVIRLTPEDTKTAEAREVPLIASLVPELASFPRVLRSPYVFTHEGRNIGSIKTAFKGACVRAGIENFRFHDLRHCGVTNLRKAGVPTGVIMSISGHKTDSMLRRYDKVDREDRKDAMERIGHFLDTAPSIALKTA